MSKKKQLVHMVRSLGARSKAAAEAKSKAGSEAGFDAKKNTDQKTVSKKKTVRRTSGKKKPALKKSGLKKAVSEKTEDTKLKVSPKTEGVRRQTELVQLEPWGMVPVPRGGRPILIMKDSDESVSLPVWLSNLEGGLVLEELSPHGKGDTPSNIHRQILEKFGGKLSRAVFAKIIGHHQYIRLEFNEENSLKEPPLEDGFQAKVRKIECRADLILSYCLHGKSPIYATPKFIEESRTLVDENLLEPAPQPKSPVHMVVKPQNYLM